MTQLKYLDTPKMEEEQAINLIVKNFPIFPISVQAYIQNCVEKKFISIWEKLGEIEPKITRTENFRSDQTQRQRRPRNPKNS